MVNSEIVPSTISEGLARSSEMFQQAKQVIPGGVTANIKFFSPHPIFMEKGKGSRLIDVDGNEYVDYLLCYGALILGHGHPKVNEKVISFLQTNGSVFGAPHVLESTMAQKLADLFPSIEMTRFTNSGLEATLLAIRLAKAVTGKRKIAKFEGHYHGGYDQVLISVNPDLRLAGEKTTPLAVPDSKGIAEIDLENTIVLPFNDIDATEQILRKHKDELAAVILEPVQGGFIPADEYFMYHLRKVTEELGILLIFDEVKTGFRAHLGGVQSIYNVKPDLTALGKVLGGGFPIGAVGGKREIMETMSPEGKQDILIAGENNNRSTDVLFHSGTYNGHPIVLTAGLATIEILEADDTMNTLLKRSLYLRKELESLYQRYHIDVQVIGMGSMFNIVFSKERIKNYRDMKNANLELRKTIDYKLLTLGIYTKPMNRYCLSVVHTEKDIHDTIEAHEHVVKQIVS